MKEFEKQISSQKEEFKQFCDKVAEKAKEQGLTEEKLADLLSGDNAPVVEQELNPLMGLAGSLKSEEKPLDKTAERQMSRKSRMDRYSR